MTTTVHHEKGHIEVGHTRDKKVPLKLYYEKTGNGPKKLLLIMGLNSPGSAWDTVVCVNCTFALACAFVFILVQNVMSMFIRSSPLKKVVSEDKPLFNCMCY